MTNDKGQLTMRMLLLMSVILLASHSAPAQAALIARGNGMIYDDVLDITWLQNASYGAGSVFDDGVSNSDGQMTWESAMAWAESLTFGGFDNWRLPSMDRNEDLYVIDCASATELACRDNEFSYMFYHNLQGSYTDDLTGDQGLFTNIQSVHWSNAEFVGNRNTAWAFGFGLGVQTPAGKPGNFGAWAVHAGDIAAIPLPAAVWLFGSGLIGLIGLRSSEQRH